MGKSANGRFVVGAVVLLAGCASPGVPKPPSLHLPEKATDVRAVRVGNTMEVSWTMSGETTDHEKIRGAVTAVVCRSVRGSCLPVWQVPGNAGRAGDTLSGVDATGPARLVEYRVELKNARGRSAGVSGGAFAALGAGPAMPAGFLAMARRDGVELRWTGVAQPRSVVEVRRTSGGESVLLAGPGGDAGGMVDRSASDGGRYEYATQRVRTVTLGGHVVELRSEPTAVVAVEYRDVFAPASPGGLVTIPGGGYGQPLVVDLSWEPNGERDVKEYRVYRAVDGGAEGLLGTVSGISYRDAAVAAGHRYVYRVGAVDAHGNESGRSAAAGETLR